MIRVAFRFDDPSPSSNQALECAIIEALASRKCSATLAVIPFKRVDGELVGLTKERATHLVDAAERGVAEIALHGFSHEQRGSAPRGTQSEFAGLASADQVDLIAQGLARLKDIFGDAVSGFVPPWNSFDAATLDALERLSFRYVSGGWESPLPYRGVVAVLPRTCNLSSLETAVKEARRAHSLSPIIIAVMHHYDFSESGDENAIIDLSGFDKLLGLLAEQPDLTILPLRAIAACLTARDCRRGLKRHRIRQALHWRLQGYVPQYSLLPAPLWRLILA